MKFNSLKKYLINLLLEIPAILIAVVLALVMTEKSEEQSKKKEAEIVLSSIVEEVKNNYSRVVFIDSVTTNVIKSNEAQIELLRNNKTNSVSPNFVTTEISNVAWETAKYSNLFSEIDPNKLKVLGSIYQEQKRATLIMENYDLFNINKDPNLSLTNKVIILNNHLYSLSSRYEDLIGRYEKFLGIKE